MKKRLPMYKYQSSATLRDLLYDNSNLRNSVTIVERYILYSYPETKEEEKIFKDILDQGCDVCFPVITNNTPLSKLANHPIEIEFYDENGVYDTSINTYDSFRSLAKNKYMLDATISQYDHSSDTLKSQSGINID